MTASTTLSASSWRTRVVGLPQMTRLALSVCRQAAPRLLAVAVILQVVAALSVVVQLLAGRALLVHLTRSGSDFTALVPVLIVLLIAFAVSAAITVGSSGLQHLLAEQVSRYTMHQVLIAASDTDLIEFESPELHDRLQRALVNASSRPTQLAIGLVGVLAASASVIGIGVTLLAISPVLALLAVVGSVPIWLFGLASSRSLYDFSVRQTEPDRQRLYIQLLLSSRDWATEVRAYRLASVMLERWRALYAQRLNDLRRVLRGRVRRGLFGVLAAVLVLAGTLGLLSWMIVTDRLSLASAGAAAAAVILLSRQLQGLASSSATLYECSLFMRDFSAFAPGAISSSDNPAPRQPAEPFRRLEVEHVSFRYPAATTAALTDISLQVGAGETIAVVGENGAGKSTLAKLIAGLYPASAGALRWNDRDYAELDLDAVRSDLAVLFQDYVKFQFPVWENIALGRPETFGVDALGAVRRAADEAGAAELISQLPDGYLTQLGPQFVGGTELSGGQWQRIALARAAYRGASVVVLDEPTAALDPLAEAALFSNTRSIFAGRAVILISHRFGSVRRADRIYVLHQGRIVEQGSHDELVAQAGRYAAMYAAQRDSLIGDGSDR